MGGKLFFRARTGFAHSCLVLNCYMNMYELFLMFCHIKKGVFIEGLCSVIFYRQLLNGVCINKQKITLFEKGGGLHRAIRSLFFRIAINNNSSPEVFICSTP